MSKKITNPMLVGIIELLRVDNTPERRRVFFEEVAKATLLTPAYITPPPKVSVDGEIELTEENNVQMPMLSAKNGEKFFMAFTDIEEMKKFLRGDAPHVLAMGFDEYAGAVLQEGANSSGFVINPQTSNIVVNKDMIMTIKLLKEQTEF